MRPFRNISFWQVIPPGFKACDELKTLVTVLVMLVSLAVLTQEAAGTESTTEDAATSVNLELATAAQLKALRKSPLQQLRVVHFWATWCAPCLEEFPQLLSLEHLFSEAGLELITVSLDQPEDRSKVVAFLSSQNSSSRNLLFEGTNTYGLLKAFDREWKELLPFTVLIDAGGEIIYRREGQLDMDELKENIRKLLYVPVRVLP